MRSAAFLSSSSSSFFMYLMIGSLQSSGSDSSWLQILHSSTRSSGMLGCSTSWTKTLGGTWARLDPSLDNASAVVLRSLSTWWNSKPSNLSSSFRTVEQYFPMESFEQSHSLFIWHMTIRESPYTISLLMPSDLAMFSPWIKAALLDAGNNNWRAYLSCSPLGAMKRIPAPAPTVSMSHQNTFAILLQFPGYQALVTRSILIRSQLVLESWLQCEVETQCHELPVHRLTWLFFRWLLYCGEYPLLEIRWLLWLCDHRSSDGACVQLGVLRIIVSELEGISSSKDPGLHWWNGQDVALGMCVLLLLTRLLTRCSPRESCKRCITAELQSVDSAWLGVAVLELAVLSGISSVHLELPVPLNSTGICLSSWATYRTVGLFLPALIWICLELPCIR
jgi:hypothetical protein